MHIHYTLYIIHISLTLSLSLYIYIYIYIYTYKTDSASLSWLRGGPPVRRARPCPTPPRMGALWRAALAAAFGLPLLSVAHAGAAGAAGASGAPAEGAPAAPDVGSAGGAPWHSSLDGRFAAEAALLEDGAHRVRISWSSGKRRGRRLAWREVSRGNQGGPRNGGRKSQLV